MEHEYDPNHVDRLLDKFRAIREMPVVTELPSTFLEGREETDRCFLEDYPTNTGRVERNDDISYYAPAPLQSQTYNVDGLLQHLQSYQWTACAKKLIPDIVRNPLRLSRSTLFSSCAAWTSDSGSPGREHQVFDVYADGVPLPANTGVHPALLGGCEYPSNALMFWEAINQINKDTWSGRYRHNAVGRISILLYRDLGPILLGAEHYTMNSDFDMDEIFHCISDRGSTAAYMHRVFDSDDRRRRTFIFNFQYLTFIGGDSQSTSSQTPDRQGEARKHGVPLARCGAVVALSLGGPPWRAINPERRAVFSTRNGYAYDPFGPWHVLNIQCHSDRRSSTDSRHATKHYANGVEAFLTTVIGEYYDALTRLETVYNEIASLIAVPMDLIFDNSLLDRLLYDDDEYTLLRRYYWAMTVLDLQEVSITAMVEAYESSFPDEVWEGQHETLWPLNNKMIGVREFYTRRISGLRIQFELRVSKLRGLLQKHKDLHASIYRLREQMYIWTTIFESRRSARNGETTVQQGHNIKMLTLDSIFFLPLTVCL